MTDLELKKLEEDLWHSADLLRAGAHMSATSYGEPILGLIFLRYADIRYKQFKDDSQFVYLLLLTIFTTHSLYLYGK